MAKSNPDPIDQKVGNRLRTRRNTLSISQEQLGNALGLTFQQVQKYEKGTNRISAGRLQQILLVAVSFFFDDGKTSHDVAGETDAQSLSHLSS